MKLFFSPSFSILISIFVLPVSGCSSVYHVQSGAENRYSNVPGIPFYVKHAQCRQQTVYLEDVRRMSLDIIQITAADQRAPSEQVVFTSSKHVLGSTAEDARSKLESYLRRMLDETTQNDLAEAFQQIVVHDPKKWRAQTLDLMLVSNERAAVLYVDYSKPYYLNARRPMIGSATLNAELNSDGTLSKGSAEIDDRTVETLLSQLPIKETLLSRWVGDDSELRAQGKAVYRARLTIEPAPVLHTLTEIERLEAICGPKTPISYSSSETGEFMYSRTTVAAAASAAPAAANAISVSGQITMPERKP